MSMMKLTPRARGLVGVRADAGNANQILAELQRTFQAFKDERDKELKDINAKLADVVQTEKVDRINAEITELTKALDDVNQVMAALQTGAGGGGAPDPAMREHAQAFDRFFRKGAEAGLRDLEVKAKLTTQSDPDGGFLVPEEVSDTIDRVLGTVSVMRQIATVMPVGSSTYKKLVNMGGANSGWVGEEEARPETNTPTLREMAFELMELYAMPATTQQMLDDGIVDIGAWLAEEVNIAFADQEGAAFISGDGTKKPRGVLAYDTVENSSYEWGKLGFVVTGGAAGFAASDPADVFVDAYYALKSGYRGNASWLMNDVVMGAVRKMKDGQGNYLWAPPASAGEVPTILQKPVYTDDNMPALGANALPIAFGDFRRGYLILDRQGVRVMRDPFTKKPYVLFYTTKRVGGGVGNFEAIKLLKCST
jgi:HK97 family phage major capsid protein